MAYYHKINGEMVPFTPEEEAERLAEEQAWEQEAVQLAAQQEQAQAIADVRSALFAEFQSLPIEIKAKFYTDKTKITDAFDDGEIEVAVYILNNIQTDTPEESAAKASLLNIISGIN